MKSKIAFFGYAGNPTTLAHRAIADGLREMDKFREIKFMLGADREDETDPGKADMLPIDMRREIARASIPFVYPLQLFAESDGFVPTIYALRALSSSGYERAVVVLGEDHFVRKERKNGPPVCDIRAWWDEGESLMGKYEFLILSRAGIEAPLGFDYPRVCSYVPFHIPECSATQVRKGIADNQDISDLVHPDAHDLIVKSYSSRI